MALVAHKYMPEQMPVEELRATFAAREHTLDFLVNALRTQIPSRTLTSYLITGPRGSGKTTLVLMLCLRLREDPELAAAWLPVRFPEELPAITSLRDLFSAALHVLAEDGVDGAHEWHTKVEREADERRSRDLAVTALRRLAEEQGRRLILVIENLDQLFERAWAKEEATLRRLLMTDPFMLIVGTTVRQFEALRAYGRAFFNYFCEVPLRRLDDEQMRALLISRAEWEGRRDIAGTYRAHQADIQAISRLTGGNARLALTIYEVLSHGDFRSAVETLRQLVDQLTPLLKDVLENQLTDQQRKIVDALMRAGGTATPSDLAGATRLSLNTVTTQLQRLKAAELVEVQGGGKGRPAHYFVPDQLFRTWYEMRYLHPHRRRIEMFLEILRSWFKAEQRLEIVKSLVATAGGVRGGPLVSAAVAAEHYAASLAETRYGRVASDLAVRVWLETGNLREAAFALAELRDVRAGDRRLYEASAYAGLGEWADAHGDLATTVGALRLALERNPANIETRLHLGVALGRRGEHSAAFHCFDQVVETADDVRQRARALLNRGVARSRQGDPAGEIADYTAVMELQGAPPEQVAKALFNRGNTRGQQGDPAGEIADYTKVIDLEDAEPDLQATALLGRATVQASVGQPHEGFADSIAVAEKVSCPLPLRTAAIVTATIATGSDERRLARVLSALQAFIASLEPEQRQHSIVEILSLLSSPGTASVWPRVWRAVRGTMSTDAATSMSFLDAVAAVLDGHTGSVLDPLPPEQREFAEEILRKFETRRAGSGPTDLGL
jgi:tetratricopeptide (TPR) repeat protein/Cdc6-like AAA superfamily ATPase